MKKQTQILIESIKTPTGLKEKKNSKLTEIKEQPNLSKISKQSIHHLTLTLIVPHQIFSDCSIEAGPSTSKAIPKYCDITGYEVIFLS